MLEIYDGIARLPFDFDVLNFALLCEEKDTPCDPCDSTYVDGILEGIELQKRLGDLSCIKEYTTIMDVVYGDNQILHGLNTVNVIIQAFAADGTMLAFEVQVLSPNEVKIISFSQTTLTNIKFVIFGSSYDDTYTDLAAAISCGSNGETEVVCSGNNIKYTFKMLIPLEIEKCKSVSSDCFNIQVRGKYKAYLKNGFLCTNIPYASVFINYQSLMEDDEGNLLVMDHPMINEYYEYAIKQRILEDLFMSDESVSNKLSLVENRLRVSRNNALSMINTPDFKELKKVWEMNRVSMYYRYYDMFKT